MIGPLVMGLFAVDSAKQAELTKIGAKDSKLLTPKQREELDKVLRTMGENELVEISAEEITTWMEKKVSLNEVEAMKLAEAILRLEKRGIHPEEVYVDSPDPQPQKYAQRILRYYSGNARIHSSNHAEGKWPPVAAASILAKVRRDKRIEEIKEKVGVDFGSGYSSDPQTREYLEKHHREPVLQPFLRHKWETVKRLAIKQKKLGEF